MEYIAVLNLLSKQDSGAIANPTTSPKLYSGNYKSKAPVICFVGVQGIGKTSIAKSIAAALGRQFNRIPLGGLADIKELRGVNKSQINAEPGQVIKSFVRTGVMNPLILLDELDKVSSGGGVNADIMAALLEILDPEQNANFTDYYLDFPVDLSKCVFIATANNLGGISAALLDRLEIIRMTSYTDDEKIHIAKDYLLPKILDQCGLKNDNLVFEEEVWPLIVRPFGFDAGMRQLERNLNQVIRKVAKRILVENATSYKVTTVNFREFFPQDIGVYS
jgi:ATP-dependent Lon protease